MADYLAKGMRWSTPRQQQRGGGGHVFCASCNSLGGREYVTEYVSWVDVARMAVAGAAAEDCYVHLRFRGRPLRFLKAVGMMLCAVNPPSLLDRQPALRKWLLEPQSTGSPEGFRFYIQLVRDGVKSRHSGFSVRGDLVTGASIAVSELAFAPFAFAVGLDSRIEDMFGIDHFAEFGLDQEADIEAILPIGHVTTPYPLDYRSAAEVEADRGDATP